RRERVERELARVHHRNTLDGREPELAVAGSPASRLAALSAADGAQSIQKTEHVPSQRAPVPIGIVVERLVNDPNDAAVRAQPQVAQVIFEQRADRIRWQAVFSGNRGKPAVFEAAQTPIESADP